MNLVDVFNEINSLNGSWSNAACMGYCLIAMRRAGVQPEMQSRVLMTLEMGFDDVSVEEAERAGHAASREG